MAITATTDIYTTDAAAASATTHTDDDLHIHVSMLLLVEVEPRLSTDAKCMMCHLIMLLSY